MHTPVSLADHTGIILAMDAATGAMVELEYTAGVAGTFTGSVAGLDPDSGDMMSVTFVNGLITNISDGQDVVFWADDRGNKVLCTVNSGVLQSANW
jgi:hypothetical protein